MKKKMRGNITQLAEIAYQNRKRIIRMFKNIKKESKSGILTIGNLVLVDALNVPKECLGALCLTSECKKLLHFDEKMWKLEYLPGESENEGEEVFECKIKNTKILSTIKTEIKMWKGFKSPDDPLLVKNISKNSSAIRTFFIVFGAFPEREEKRIIGKLEKIMEMEEKSLVLEIKKLKNSIIVEVVFSVFLFFVLAIYLTLVPFTVVSRLGFINILLVVGMVGLVIKAVKDYGCVRGLEKQKREYFGK